MKDDAFEKAETWIKNIESAYGTDSIDVEEYGIILGLMAKAAELAQEKQTAFAAGQAAEREVLQAKIDDLSVWCEAVQADIVYCCQIDEMIRKRGEN